MKKEIVISAYDKSLDWVSQINSDVKVTIYRKGDILPVNQNEIVLTPNKGRCVHTFFNHIYINYDNLCDYTFFVQDYPFDHWGNLLEILNSEISTIENKASLVVGGYYGFHNNTLGTAWSMSPSKHFENGRVISCNSNGHPQDYNPNINVDKYWKILFSDKNPTPNFYEFIPGGHFVLEKNHVKVRSKKFYEEVTNILKTDEFSPWMIERLECYIFDPRIETNY